MSATSRSVFVALVVPALLAGQTATRSPAASATTRVGPPRGTVIVVGGGSMGPEIYSRFIEAAGGPDALILDVPNAGGASSYTDDGPGIRGWRAAGARNIHVLFTTDRKVADSDSFVAVIRRAKGIWFEGGRQYRLVDAYAGTKTEVAFNDVLARGGVVGGSSAGASILGDFLVRGAPSNNNFIMDYPGYQKGFSYLRGVGIDQHVVARSRLADLADSIMTKYPALLGISEDEGTAWVVTGDTATIIGRNKAFVYGGSDATDPGSPFLTLHPGDTYDLGARRVMRRAIEGSPLTGAFVDGLFTKYADPSAGGATVLVAQDGRVLIDRSYGVSAQPSYMPTTTVPQFALGDLSGVFGALCAQLPAPPTGRGGAAAPDGASGGARGAEKSMTAFQTCVGNQLARPIGLHRTTASADGEVQSNVDELYRLALGLEQPRTYRDVDRAKGWQADTVRGAARLVAYGAAGGKRNAFVRMPGRHATIIILTNDESADARGIADAIAERLLSAPAKR